MCWGQRRLSLFVCLSPEEAFGEEGEGGVGEVEAHTEHQQDNEDHFYG